jgi:hypothetical protein
MVQPFLAFGLWCVVFTLAIMGLLTSGAGNPDFTGTIVLDYKPFCQSFVVQTERGFMLLLWEDGTLFFGEGDTVTGPLHTQGLRSIEVADRGKMEVRVETWFADIAAAQTAFRERCGLDPSMPLAGPLLR